MQLAESQPRKVVVFVTDTFPSQYIIVEFPTGHCFIVCFVVILKHAPDEHPGLIVTFVILFPTHVKDELGVPHDLTKLV